jgi:hypothetical protein
MPLCFQSLRIALGARFLLDDRNPIAERAADHEVSDPQSDGVRGALGWLRPALPNEVKRARLLPPYSSDADWL